MNDECGNKCGGCPLEDCCILRYARSVGIVDEHVKKMLELSKKAEEKLRKYQCESEAASTESTLADHLTGSYLSAIDKEGDNFLDRFPKPEIFNLVQAYQMLLSIGEPFDLKDRYYQLEISMITKKREAFINRLIDGEALTLRTNALILQRADQLLKAVNGECARNGICEGCWLVEICEAKAERG